ncbi:MAG: outer membrane beta-barrel protein [Gammaproteobacteria bacterium]|nr:outer membrane beta-barrel protein [Gammaproteobacteria bacterium]
MKRAAILSTGAMLLSASVSHAQLPDLTYNRVGVSYVYSDVDEIDENSKGLFLNGSMELGDHVHVWGVVGRTWFDYILPAPGTQPVDVDFEAWLAALGAGVHHDLSDRVNAYARVGINSVDSKAEISLPFPVEGDSPDDSSVTSSFEVGIRFSTARHLELFAGVGHQDDATSSHVGLEIPFIKAWAARVLAVVSDDSDGIGVAVVRRF